MVARSTGCHDAAVPDVVSVLVVDDLAGFRRATASVIDVTDGFSIAGEASSGEEAITFLEQTPVDLVLMDVIMPGIGGLAAAAAIRSRFPMVRILLLSMYLEQHLPQPVPSGCQFCDKGRFGPDALEALWQCPPA